MHMHVSRAATTTTTLCSFNFDSYFSDKDISRHDTVLGCLGNGYSLSPRSPAIGRRKNLCLGV